MNSIKVSVPDGSSGDWKVDTFTVDEEAAKHHALSSLFAGTYARKVPAGTYKRLSRNGTVVMSNTPAECGDHWEPIAKAKGNVLINGLGLGVVLTAILAKPEVERVTVVEASADVIALVAPSFIHAGKPVTIVHADAFAWKPPCGVRYDVVWHDIWDEICADNLPDMHRLHRRYGRRADWQGSWCRWMCERQRREDKKWNW